MKIIKTILFALLLTTCMIPATSFAQEEKPSSPFSLGADLYSNYIWRGSKFGTGPAFQPSVKFAAGGLTVGVWGSFDASGYTEADPYISYSLPFGLSVGVTDYYYPTHIDSTNTWVSSDYFDFNKETSFHAFEINVGYTLKGLSLSGNYILNEATGAASAGGDMYFEAGYSFSNFKLFAGAGDGWHTSDGEFTLCNIGLSTSKTIEITDKFSIPVSGSVILNPEKKQFFLVVGFSF